MSVEDVGSTPATGSKNFMALFGNKRGLKWWGIIRKLEAAVEKAQKKFDKIPSKQNGDKLTYAKLDLLKAPAYYD